VGLGEYHHVDKMEIPKQKVHFYFHLSEVGRDQGGQIPYLAVQAANTLWFTVRRRRFILPTRPVLEIVTNVSEGTAAFIFRAEVKLVTAGSSEI
jgi:hypothetical protein